jgi:hypothetical protein
MPCPSQSSRLHNPNDIWQEKQRIKLRVM